MTEPVIGRGRGRGRGQSSSSIAPPSPSLSNTSLTPVTTTSENPATSSDEGIASSIQTLNITQSTTAIKSLVPRGRGQFKRDVPPSEPEITIPVRQSEITTIDDDTLDISKRAVTTTNQSQITSVNDTLVTTSQITTTTTSSVISKKPGRSCFIPANESSKFMVSELTSNQFLTNVRPLKPKEPGKLGQAIEVMVNYYPVTQYPKKGIVYQYHVDIKSAKDVELQSSRRRAIYDSWKKIMQHNMNMNIEYRIVFDNNSIILSLDRLTDIDKKPMTFNVRALNRYGKQENFKFIIHLTDEPIDFAELALQEKSENFKRLKQVLSIVLHEQCSSTALFASKRAFYSIPTVGNAFDLGEGKALWRGFYSCLMFSKGNHKLLVNLDVSHSCFLKKQPFLDFLREVMVKSPCGVYDGRGRRIEKVTIEDCINYLDPVINQAYYQGELKFLTKLCKGMRVRANLADKKIIYTIDSLGQSASIQTFPWKIKQKESTVEEYYREHHSHTLRYHQLPVLKMKNNAYLPMELVDVEPARVQKINDDQRATITQKTSEKPFERIRQINYVRGKEQKFEEDPFVRAWNLNINADMLIIWARVLPMPTIHYTRNYEVTERTNRGKKGVWEAQGEFYKPTPFPEWGMINMTDLSQSDCEAFYDVFARTAKERGITCPPPSLYEQFWNHQERCSSDIDQISQFLKKVMERTADYKFLLFILMDNNKHQYGPLKSLCELDFGIVTQMLKRKNARKGTKRNPTEWNHSLIKNLLLKVNPKLNGTNSILKLDPDSIIANFFSAGHDIMYCGADLSHAPPGSLNRDSVVAVVASSDDIPNRYFKQLRVQHRPPQAKGQSWEYIVDLEDIMHQLILQYYKYRKSPPRAIVFYRDGISESEFDSVFEKELYSIRTACVRICEAYRPYITYIVVQKRHRTRFFPGTNENVQAGTVVDSHDVTHPFKYDFFLNSHYGQLGTSRPTHYHVLYDDNRLTPDKVQMLTYALCYTYARCTRSVSIPAPVKYADLLALRAAYYLRLNEMSDTESIASGRPLVPSGQEIQALTIITSDPILLSENLAPDSPFFL